MFNNNLRKYRSENNLTQLGLAKLTDISPSDISSIETGRIIPYPGWRRRIAEALELPEEAVFPGFKEARTGSQTG